MLAIYFTFYISNKMHKTHSPPFVLTGTCKFTKLCPVTQPRQRHGFTDIM